MTSRASSPRRLQSQNSFKKQENGMDSPVHPGRHPLRPIPEASASKSSSGSEQTDPGSPARPPTPRGKKRAAAVYRQSENVDGNIGSASNTPEKPREKRSTLARVSKGVAPWSSKLPVTASLARSFQETDAATKSWDTDSVGGTPTPTYRTPLIPTSGISKSGSTEQTSRSLKISGKPPLDSELSKACFSASNSSLLQSTPSRSVNRSLRYGVTPGSATSVGSTRAPGNATKSSGSFQFGSSQLILAQQFDFEEDPTFWEDHNVQVILRTRPISQSESVMKGFSRCIRQENSHSITWLGQPETRFTFDHVAGEHVTQEKLFTVAGVPMVENCMAGYNSCMFCYGQTGSGKTHTMLGDIVDLEHQPSDDRGMTPRVFEYLFSKIQEEQESRTDEHLKFVCKCSFLEIFNEQITDLLEPTSTNLQVREGGKKGVYVENLSEVAVRSVQDVVHLLLLGAANRKVAATNMNRESSRSHSVFTCTIESKWEFNSMTNIRFGRLNLVDLAGSERQKTSGAEGERLKEAANINKSLSTLGLVIMILVDVANGKQRHVPYRDSKLTYLLQDSLGGNSKTTMIANISPSSCCALETLSTLKFAQRAKFIQNNAVVNEDASGDVNGLRQEIQELKEELDRIKRQDLPRTPSMQTISSVLQDSMRKGDLNLGTAMVAVDGQELSRCSLDSWDFNKSFSGPRFPCKKLEALEAVLAGALRREQEAEFSQRRQEAEIEQLTRLVKQREDDGQCSKMLLRFREDKIRRLEAQSAGLMSTDIYLRQENDFLLNELRLMQEKAERNPELTRFAMENIRLLEQLRRYQDFYTGGEREAMAEEISNLRDQLLEVLDSKLSLTALTSPQKEALAPELAAAQREIELLRIETDNYRREVEDCRKNLSSILEANSRITKQLDESNAELREVKLENRVHQEELQKMRERVLDAEAIEWGHSQHVELISNLKIKLQESEERHSREASLRLELEEQLCSSLQRAADLQEDLQETRGALDAAEVLVSRLQSAEADFSVAQEMATIAQNAVRQIYLETKEIAEDQRLSLKHTEDSVVAACLKEIELREELKEARSLILKLSSTKDEPNFSVGPVTENEQVLGVPDCRTVRINQLEQDLKSLDLLSDSDCTPQSTSSVNSSRGETENLFDESSTTKREQSLYLDQGKDCVLKLNFIHEIETANDQSLLESELCKTGKKAHASRAIISKPPGDRDLQVLQRNNIDHTDLELVSGIRSLQEEIMKLKPQVKTDEERKADANWSKTELLKELQSLILVVHSAREERKNLAAQNAALLKEKDDVNKARLEREAATSRLLEHLHEGEHALTDAVHEMEGILDDCLSQPNTLGRGRVSEQELMYVPHLDATTTPTAKEKDKDTDQARQAGGNDHLNGLKRNFAICTIMLQWFSETLNDECSATKNLKLQNDRAKEELWNKDCLISSLKTQLGCALANLSETDSLVSKLQNKHDGSLARLQDSEAQVTAAVNVEARLLDDIGKCRLELASVLKRMDDTRLELAQAQDVSTVLRVEFTDSERERQNLSLEKEQLAEIFAHDKELLERSCTVATTMVWWLQSEIAAHEEAQTLYHDDIAFQVRERDRMVCTLEDEITEKAMLLEKHMGNEKSLANQNFEHIQEIDLIKKKMAEDDSLSRIMQSRVSELQDELSATECRSMQLAMEKEKLHIQLSELTKISEDLQREVSSVRSDLEEADAKVVELATVQAGMLIVQEEWGLEKDGLERGTAEAKQRSEQLEQELELARNVALKLETELEAANTRENFLREEGEKVVSALQEELERSKISAEAFKDQLELNQITTMELDSRLQKHLIEWEIEKERMSSAAVLAYDQCLEKDQSLTSMQADLVTLQSQLSDACSRESKLFHELEEVLQLKENIHLENEKLRSNAEELVLDVSRKGEEISSLQMVLELKLETVDDKVDNTHRQMKAILLDLDVLVRMKEELEAEAESIEHNIVHHISSVEQQLVNVNEDKIQLEELFAKRESELLGELNTVQSENVSFDVRVRALEDALEDSRILIKKKEEERTVVHRDLAESESKAVETHEKLRAANSLLKELARSEEQLKLQKDALAAENKRLTRCMACREMEFSSLQGQMEGLENSLKESLEKERMTSTTLTSLKEDLKVLEKQWQRERDQLKDRLVTSNRELVESQELNQSFYQAFKELEDEVMAIEKKSKMTINELEKHWSIARGEMSDHLSHISLDFLEVKSCAEKTHLDLAHARSLVSAADAAIEQLLEKNSVLEGSNNELLAKQEALQLELSRWEQYAVELHKDSDFDPSLCSDISASAVSSAIPLNNYFDILKTQVEKIRCECEKLRAQIFEKDKTILSVQMELSDTIASNRQMGIELSCVANERSDLEHQLNNTNKALSNARDEVRCRDAELNNFEGELQKVTEMLVKTEETMDESTRGWRAQIKEVMAEMEALKLCASEKSSEVTMLRKQFEDGQATLQEAETLIDALVRANESAKHDVLKWKSREDKMALQSSEMLSMINEEVSVTMDHVEKHLQDMSLDIRGMRTLLTNICSGTGADIDREFKEFMGIQISEIERATEESHMKLATMNVMTMDSERRLHESARENYALQISFNNAQALLVESQAALEEAMQDMELQQKGYLTTREELQRTLSSLAGKSKCISELTSDCNRLSARNAELERLSTETYEELSTNLKTSKELEIEKLSLVDASTKLQASNNNLHGQVQQLEMSLADAISVKHMLDMEIVGLRQQNDFHEDEIRTLRDEVSASHDAVKAGAAKLLETEIIIQALNSDLVNCQNEKVCVQQSLNEAATIMDGLRQHIQELEEKEMKLTAEAESQRQAFERVSEKLAQSEDEFDAAMRILATMLETTSSELHAAEASKADLEEKNIKFSSMLASLQVAVSQMGQEKGFLSEKISVLDEDKMKLLEQLETQSKQLRKQSLEASAASTTHELQLEILKIIIESASAELQDKDHMLFAIKEELEQSSARCVALDAEKEDLLGRLEIRSLELCKLSEETNAASAALKIELDGLKASTETASRELQEKELMILALKEELEQSSARCVALDAEKEDLLGRLEIRSLELCKLSEETNAASAALKIELDGLKASTETASRELQEKELMILALKEELEQSSARCVALDAEKEDLLGRLEIRSLELCKLSEETNAASAALKIELDGLKASTETASRELQEKELMILALKEELEQSSARCVALDAENEDLLGRLEIRSLELCKLSEETNAASAALKIELDGLKASTETASRELQEKELIILALKEELEQSSARCVALDAEKEDLLGRLEIRSLELCKLSEETSAASVAHQIDLDVLKASTERASRELQEKELIILALKEELEQSSARCVALDGEKEDVLGRLDIRSLELCKLSEETRAASAAHQIEIEISKIFIEDASFKMQEEDQLISSLRDNLEKSSENTMRTLNSLETAVHASAQTQHERDEILATANNLESENTALREAIDLKSRKCADLEKEVLRLQTEVQEVPIELCEQKLELEILTTMLESAVQESREKDLMASELENLLSQSQSQNAEMLQSSQEVVNHFSLFQSQLDACFQLNNELERNKLALTAEVYSQSQELAELKELLQASEKSLEEFRISFTQLEKQKNEEIRVLSNEVEKLKSQEAAMEVDLWDWEQRCQDSEVQLDEKTSELEFLKGKLRASQEEYKEQAELVDDELRQCQRRIADMDTERQEFMNEIEEGSSVVAELQAKLQSTENEMEEHFSRHSIEQEVVDSLENENRELQSCVKFLTAEVAANQQRATAAENLVMETRLEMEALDRDLKQKDDLLQSLESDLNLLQESALQELRLNQELESMRVTTGVLEQELTMQKDRRSRLEIELGQITEDIVQIRNQAATWKGKAYELETELDKKQQTIESLEDELRVAEQNMANTLEEATVDLKEVENERDRLQIEVLELTEQLEMTQTVVEERDAVISELHQAEEQSRTHAKEKDDEVELLTRSVHELESTVYALESQLGLLSREAERQRLLREDIEMESQKLNNHIFMTQSALEESNSRNAEELKGAYSALKEKERKVEEKESEISHLKRKLGNLEISSRDKDVQIKDAMAQISDLLLAAELQKADFQQKLKAMESVMERSKSVRREIPSSHERASEVKSVEADPAPETQSHGDMTHVSGQSRIKELEELALSRQKEIFTLNTRLAEAESMTHDVLRDLLGVKTDMNNVVSILGHQQIKQLAETACRKHVETEEMETELSSLRSQLKTYIEERESWVEEINLRQCEMVAARVAAEKLRQKEQVLTDEIEKFRIENINHQEKIRELEMEIRQLPTSQQTFYQQINHHAKIREENQALKLANEELSKELRRTELLYAGMHDELVLLKSADSKRTVDEEHLHLRHLLQDSEDSRDQAAQTLSGLCIAIMQAAGLPGSNTVDSSAAMDTLQLIESRLRNTERELSEPKHKTKFAGERRRRTSDIRAKDSPLRSISNFTELLQRSSSPSPAPR